MTYAIYLITSFVLLSTILPYLGSRGICFIILLILLGIWLLCYENTYKFIKKESKKSYRNLKRYIKKTKKYKLIAIPLYILIAIILIYLAYITISVIIYFLLFMITLGAIGLASPNTVAWNMRKAYEFKISILPYILCVLSYVLIIKDIVFKFVLYKFLNKKTKNNTYAQTKKFCTNCGTELTEKFCTNCGKEA